MACLVSCECFICILKFWVVLVSFWLLRSSIFIGHSSWSASEMLEEASTSKWICCKRVRLHISLPFWDVCWFASIKAADACSSRLTWCSAAFLLSFLCLAAKENRAKFANDATAVASGPWQWNALQQVHEFLKQGASKGVGWWEQVGKVWDSC